MTLLTWKSIRVKYKSPDMAKYFTPPQDLNTQVLMVYGDDDNIVAPVRSKYASTFYKSVHMFPHEGAHYVPNKRLS